MLKVHAKKSHGAEVLCLEGQIVTGDTDILRHAVQLASGPGDIILDLANVTNLDAHGLGVLLQLREQTLAQGGHFELTNVSRRLFRIFEITRLHTVFKLNRAVEFFTQVAYAERMPVAA